ncbi:MAG: bifunctional folylpolyglutamate synthase/dihydrofolate synthase [Chitinophagaceae bacterium]|nr:bifunctional folylpolyglutamate synthase/dihydrofolate synthase [Chitinophagaceae bacterium]
MNYDETLSFLFNRLPMFSRTGADAYKAGLDNIVNLSRALDNPHHSFKTIHVAGTNGKGSVSHMLAAILQQAGYKTGLYTSPHLKDFRERIKVDGEMVSRDYVVAFTREITPLIDELNPSFFEITVAMAFSHFAKEKVDIAVIETGLGGRLDSTNIITPELSVITNIGFDHMNLLGNTLTAIAGEKAGIIKQEVPVVIGEATAETLPVFQAKAREMNAPLFFANETREVVNYTIERNTLVATVKPASSNHKEIYQLDLPGIYQTKNLLTVLESCTQLQEKGWNISEEHMHEALKHTKQLTGLHGRWELIRFQPQIVLDVAHNVDGITQLLQQVKETPHEKLHIVLGMVKDKDVKAVLQLLPASANYYFTKAQIPRALPEDELQQLAAETGLQGKCFSTVDFALISAAKKAGKNDLVIVCGSVFLVGEVSNAAIKEIWGKEDAGGWQYAELLSGLDFFI